MSGVAVSRLPLGTVCKYPCLCGGKMKLREASFGIFYGCASFPNCYASVSAHQSTGEPMGTPADEETKAARMRAHLHFDKLWDRKKAQFNPLWKKAEEFKLMRRGEAYEWLRKKMKLTKEEAHIGLFTKAQCELVVVLVESKLARME